MLGISQAHLGHMSGISQAYLRHGHGYIIGKFWADMRHILGVSQSYHGHIKSISLAYLGYILGISWAHLRHISDISRAYHGHIMGISWACLWHILGISLILLSIVLSRLVVRIVVKIGCQYCSSSPSASSVSIFGIFCFKRCFPRFSWLLAEEQQNGDHFLLFLNIFYIEVDLYWLLQRSPFPSISILYGLAALDMPSIFSIYL